MPYTEFAIPLGGGTQPAASVTGRWFAPDPGGVANAPVLVLAHGAGAPQAHPFMVTAASQIASRGVAVATFNFDYMERRKKVPDRAPALEACWLSAIAAVRARPDAGGPLFIGGKSMGGRMASHVAAHHHAAAGPLAGLVFLGYPLHPPGKPDQRRDAHLPEVATPMLFVQGSRDAFGTPDELRPVLDTLGTRATLFEVEGGDHSFAVPRGAGRTRDQVLGEIWDRVVEWMRRVLRSSDGVGAGR